MTLHDQPMTGPGNPDAAFPTAEQFEEISKGLFYGSAPLRDLTHQIWGRSHCPASYGRLVHKSCEEVACDLQFAELTERCMPRIIGQMQRKPIRSLRGLASTTAKNMSTDIYGELRFNMKGAISRSAARQADGLPRKIAEHLNCSYLDFCLTMILETAGKLTVTHRIDWPYEAWQDKVDASDVRCDCQRSHTSIRMDIEQVLDAAHIVAGDEWVWNRITAPFASRRVLGDTSDDDGASMRTLGAEAVAAHANSETADLAAELDRTYAVIRSTGVPPEEATREAVKTWSEQCGQTLPPVMPVSRIRLIAEQLELRFQER